MAAVIICIAIDIKSEAVRLESQLLGLDSLFVQLITVKFAFNGTSMCSKVGYEYVLSG